MKLDRKVKISNSNSENSSFFSLSSPPWVFNFLFHFSNCSSDAMRRWLVTLLSSVIVQNSMALLTRRGCELQRREKWNLFSNLWRSGNLWFPETNNKTCRAKKGFLLRVEEFLWFLCNLKWWQREKKTLNFWKAH